MTAIRDGSSCGEVNPSRPAATLITADAHGLADTLSIAFDSRTRATVSGLIGRRTQPLTTWVPPANLSCQPCLVGLELTVTPMPIAAMNHNKPPIHGIRLSSM